ncbi:dolichyl-phosphate-mannose-protein mannosyltransferase 2 [Microdochium bolleyi]|uniref:Dolichyl-phosphate-mannose--protein mannosyltransferase n=1 Tax=Microdochium bolleyi TaxID=196109 RepID=A0A136JIJ1_9PEZI|nr:dolichyl-phosphate-mannose-protein mannosyltransferase 2 [Microdochium bolleyi]
MAEQKVAVASGADAANDALRRRNVPQDNVAVVQQVQPDEKKLHGIKKEQGVLQILDEWESVIAPIIFTALAIFTRLYKIGLSPIVTWDEAHFGKFGSHYIKRDFFFDVHPPLGKILVGLSGVMAGYNGTFEFKSGEKYPEELNYTFMRAFNAFWGILCIPLAYYTARELKLKRPAVWLVTLMVLCENSYTTISRFILLDSMLLFGTVVTVFCWAKFHGQQKNAFEPEWFIWLFLTGLSLGFVCSIKLVGLFVTALVGIYTIEDLWRKFGNTKMPPTVLGAHFAARVVGLIVIPGLVYLFSFALHFAILTKSGPGDAQMSSLFQANLEGTEIGRNSPLEIAIGSRVTIKNMGYGGGLLHSHVQTYPDGSQQQQVTCYHHKDTNNDWWFYPSRTEAPYDPADETAEPRFVKNGDTIRLIHASTGRNLHSHDIAAPVSKSMKEVSCYGNLTVGDDKDHWQVEIVKDVNRDKSQLRTLTSSFRLKHPFMGCYLRAGNTNLPQWGFKQIEVTCDKKNNPKDTFTHWNIEAHTNERLPPGDPGKYKSPFFHDFIHLNVAMMTSNNALVPDPDKQDDLASKWWQWPILHVGLRMCGWNDDIVKYFLLGNPFVYWVTTASLGVVGLVAVWYILRWQRGFKDLSQEDIDQIHYAGIYPVMGWFLHYLPFVIMARVTYVHHYYPALYFAILAYGFLVDFFAKDQKKAVQYAVYGTLYTIIIGLYIYFIPICFGMTGPNKNYSYMKWFSTWRVSD